MVFTQSFRAVGDADIEEIPCDLVDDQYVIFWENVELVFPSVKFVKNGKVTITMMRDSTQQR
jgi:hypothetical protein